MRVICIDDGAPSAEGIGEAAAVISRGGVVAYPTDTLYGLAVDPRDVRAVERVYAIKGRDFSQPLPLIAADQRQAGEQAGALSPLARVLATEFWPGPLALLLEANPSLCRRVHASTGCVAVRVPAHRTARALARAVAHPITATSANVSGARAPATAEEVARGLGDRLDLVLDAGATRGGAPSTIVDARGEVPRLVRDGAVPWDRVLRFFECARSNDPS